MQRIYEILNAIPVTEDNKKTIKEIKKGLKDGDYVPALQKLKDLANTQPNPTNLKKEDELEKTQEIKQLKKTDKSEKSKGPEMEKESEEAKEEGSAIADEPKVIKSDRTSKNYNEQYSGELNNTDLERIYIGLLLNNPKLIMRFYFMHDICLFRDTDLLNIYKSVLFTEGQAYAPEVAKRDFNFAKSTTEIYNLKQQLEKEMSKGSYNEENIYLELKKIFILRREYIRTPVKEIQDKIVDITGYKLYHKMSEEEVKNAIEQVNVTGKFKQAILNKNLTSFLEKGDNNLTNGLDLPFLILSNVFKGLRVGETMAFAMPSNSGKSRFSINLATYTAFVHKKKVLIISNEMSEEKMRLCLITTIINNPVIQKIHGQKLSKTEGELLEFKFRADNKSDVEVDSDGFVLQREKETHEDFVKRLSKVSTEFNKTIAITDWINKEINNSIYFINITDHTNDELRKVIMNYYYSEKIEYIFYDTLKTDTENIGNAEELKKTATILSNLAQNFSIFICSTLQLTETDTLPVNLTIKDLAVSRTVKEVLDTLCLIKQISRDNLRTI